MGSFFANAIVNWQTSLLGLGALLPSLGHIVTSVGNSEMPNGVDVQILLAGLMGLVSKDWNRTGVH